MFALSSDFLYSITFCMCVHHRIHTEWRLPISDLHPIMIKNQPWLWLVRVGGARPPSFSLMLSHRKLQWMLQLREQIHSPCFISTLFVLCGVYHFLSELYCRATNVLSKNWQGDVDRPLMCGATGYCSGSSLLGRRLTKVAFSTLANF
jgi:hypothetical protein